MWKIFLLLVILCGVVLRVSDVNRKAYFEVFTALRVSGYDEHDDANPALYTGQPIGVATIQKFQTFNDEKNLFDTVRGLVRKEPQVAPLYFVIAALVSRAVNDTPFGTRLVSVLSSILAVGAVFWLSVELFRNTNAAWWAAALAAASPLWLRYAQEARMYMLWLALLLAACALCVRATRTNQLRWWVLYALVLMLSLYAHPLGILTLGALGIYALASSAWRITRPVWTFGLASGAALFLFLPWVRYIILNFGTFRATTAYMGEVLPFGTYLFSIGSNFTRLFLGLTLELSGWMALLVVPLAALSLYAVYFLLRRAPRAPALFVLALILCNALPFLLLDLVLGGYRAGLVHYLWPALVGIEISLGYLFASRTRAITQQGWRGRAWQATAIVLLMVSLVSTGLTWASPAWWDILGSDVQVASIVEQKPGRIMVTDVVFGELARLSYSLPADTRFVATKAPATLTLRETDTPIFVYKPSPALKARLEQLGNTLQLVFTTMEPDSTVTMLYRMMPP